MSARGNDRIGAELDKFDRFGRYKLPDPNTGKPRAYTRTTTLAKCLADTSALERWKLRTAADGFARRPDLLEVIAAEEDKGMKDSLVEAALKAGGAGDAAQLGTDLHHTTELVDAGTMNLEDVPDHQYDDVRSYVFTMARAGIEIIPAYIERLVVNGTIDVAGTFDRVVRLRDGRLVVADLKTGKNLSYGWGDIAIQLAIYANADGMYDEATGTYEPMPEVDKQTAIVMHLPVGKGSCTLWEVDIAAGWEAALLARTVREWRSRKGLADLVDLGAMVLDDIRAADTVPALEALYLNNTDLWTTRHTAAATARKMQLLKAAA